MRNNVTVAIFFTCLLLNIAIFSKEVDEPSFVDTLSYSKENVTKYSKFGIEGTSWLAFRDIPEFINKYVKGNKVLDLGCGTGRSTRFLKSFGLNVVGADISSEYLIQANNLDSSVHYLLMDKEKIPLIDNNLDFVFSSFVLLMASTKEHLNNHVREINRVLKKDGIFIAATGSEEMHSPKKQWVSYETDFPENHNPKSGHRLRVFIKGVGAEFYDYNWTKEDYSQALKENGFEILETHYPLGKENEGYQWLSEKDTSPYIVYVAKKI